ncbi:MAG: hypothetical protein HDR83_00910, partial [Bacteroides sp.]|nr:hypothetical protein [Bacteroides sp.]
PYGYLRDGVFHAYVFDYQGNVMAVVAGNNVVQTNLYYPDGLPMNTSTGTTANAFKYTAKELSLFRGLPVYDFTARHTLPQLGNRFRVMDPFCESYADLSPYSFCGGDPVNKTDKTGMIIEKASIKTWYINKVCISLKYNDLIKNINSNTESGIRVQNLRNTLKWMSRLEKSDLRVGLNPSNKGVGNITPTSLSSIIINYDGTVSNFVHEVTHGKQILNEELMINESEGEFGITLRDINDEVEAYQAQYSYDPESFSVVSSYDEITGDLLRRIEVNGAMIYSNFAEENITLESMRAADNESMRHILDRKNEIDINQKALNHLDDIINYLQGNR